MKRYIDNEEENEDEVPIPWHFILLSLTTFAIGVIVGISMLMVAARIGWWDFI